MKNSAVINAFLNGDIGNSNTLSSDGTRLSHYDTVIAFWGEPGECWVNETKYSATTGQHVSYLKGVLYYGGREATDWTQSREVEVNARSWDGPQAGKRPIDNMEPGANLASFRMWRES